MDKDEKLALKEAKKAAKEAAKEAKGKAKARAKEAKQNVEAKVDETLNLTEADKKEIKKKVKKTVKGMGIKLQLLLTTLVPVILAVVLLAIVSMYCMIQGMRTEVYDGLTDLTIAVEAGYDLIDTGDYFMNGTALCKGDANLEANLYQIDEFTEGSDSAVALFYGDTIEITSLLDESGNRMVGYQADPKIAQEVLVNGNTYEERDVYFAGVRYFAVFRPIYDSKGSICGMIFAGKPQVDISARINGALEQIFIAAAIMLVIAIVGASVVASKLAKALVETEELLSTVADGDLTVTVPEKYLNRKDEIGSMARALENLAQKLHDIIAEVISASTSLAASGVNLGEMAEHTDNTAGEISRAVEEISKGAVMQAEEVETANTKVGDIGEEISMIAERAVTLDDASSNMKKAGDQSSENVKELQVSSEQTKVAIETIETLVQSTNESVQKIKNAVVMINEIAEQTNLLSLNASIEAARAGEMGRGFAVVASEISSLATQSATSSEEIETIVTKLFDESEKSVVAMEEAAANLKVQEQKLKDMTTQFRKVEDGIAVSKNEAASIRQQSEKCDAARKVVVDAMSNLSAISEENAASTQETTASMQELNATISLLATEAKNVSEQASMLEEKIKIFTV